MKKYIPVILSAAVAFSSCDLLSPADVENPNVVVDDFVSSPDAMKAWINGTNAAVAVGVGTFVEDLELLSDNYYNNYTRSSKTFDKPEVSYRSIEVSKLSTHVGKMVEMATFGLEKVAPGDPATTDAQRFNLSWIRAYGHLLAGENFVALPAEARGEVLEWPDLLKQAVRELQAAMPLAQTEQQRAFLYTLMARAYHRLGDRQQAVTMAEAALAQSADMVQYVHFDGINGVVNSAHEYIGSYMFQPLPRLDFLDPKYPFASYWDAPIAIAKSEECYLILAEAAAAENRLTDAASSLHQLLSLVATRPAVQVTDIHDNRDNGGTMVYPNGADYRVAASAADPLRPGLVRQHGTADSSYAVAILSGTSVDAAMIDAATASKAAMVELIYLMRQEIFFAEGRRSSDLGIRLPLSEVEAALHANLPAAYTQPVIPSYIPKNGEMDAFTINSESRTVTILHNMNKEIPSVFEEDK